MVLGQTRERSRSFLKFLQNYRLIFPSSSQSVGFFGGSSFYHVRRLKSKGDFEELCFVLPMLDSILVSCEVSDNRWLEKAIQYGLASQIAAQSAHAKGLYIEVTSQQQMQLVLEKLIENPEISEIYDRVVVGHLDGKEELEELIQILRSNTEKIATMGLRTKGCFCQ